MKFIFLGVKPSVITGYTENWMYNLPKAIKNYGDVEFYPRYDNTENWLPNLLEKAKDATAIIALGVRYFSTTDIPFSIVQELCDKFRGYVLQQVDTDQIFEVNKVGVRNLCVSYTGRHLDYNYKIGWAYNKDIFYYSTPDYNTNILKVFVDHSTFTGRCIDYSLSLYLSLRDSKIPMEVRTLTDKGIEVVDLNNINIRPFSRVHLPIEDFAKQLQWADIFCSTHSESLGLTLLEAAACGALPVVMEGTVPKDRLNTILHYSYRFLDLQEVLPLVDKLEVSNSALSNSWENVAESLFLAIQSLSKEKK